MNYPPSLRTSLIQTPKWCVNILHDTRQRRCFPTRSFMPSNTSSQALRSIESAYSDGRLDGSSLPEEWVSRSLRFQDLFPFQLARIHFPAGSYVSYTPTRRQGLPPASGDPSLTPHWGPLRITPPSRK